MGIVLYAAATTAYYCSAILLPKALVDQGAAVSLSFGLGTLLFVVTIPGKFFTGFIMEIIGRRWTITYCLGGRGARAGADGDGASRRATSPPW